MRDLRRKFIFLVILALFSQLLTSCAKEIFSTKKNKSTSSVNAKTTYTSAEICSTYSVVKPKVDFLFLWDNTGSQNHVDAALKNSFSGIVNRISSEFDYHILMAPLVGSSTSSGSYLVAYNDDGLASNALNRKISYQNASYILDQIVATPEGPNLENGFTRAYQMINENRSNGIFRNSSYLIIVVMTNGDVRTYDSGYWIHPYQNLTQDKNSLLNLRNSLSSEQMRFMTLVSHNNDNYPTSDYRKGYAYIDMSRLIYTDPGQRTQPTDQNGNATPDSYNIVGADYNHMFDGINQTITMITVAHEYDYWPVEISGNYDSDTLRVLKYNSSGNYYLTPNDTSNGFQYIGYKTNQNTRYAPTSGEPYTGIMVRLFGSGRVKYPECVIISADEISTYYGFFTLSGKPNPSTITCTKNGVTVPASSTNGWEYINYQTSKNVKIESPSNPSSPGLPAQNETGYMLKLNGSAIYTNGETFQCYFNPSS